MAMRSFFKWLRRRLRCSVKGVTSLWIFGALECVLPSLPSFTCGRRQQSLLSLQSGPLPRRDGVTSPPNRLLRTPAADVRALHHAVTACRPTHLPCAVLPPPRGRLLQRPLLLERPRHPTTLLERTLR